MIRVRNFNKALEIDTKVKNVEKKINKLDIDLKNINVTEDLSKTRLQEKENFLMDLRYSINNNRKKYR